MSGQKKSYSAPQLTRHGTLEEITQFTNSQVGSDSVFGFGPPPTS